MTGQQLKNSILQMAVQGKLVPQDPNDEPASVLLERIRAEKETLIKAGKIKKEKNPSVIFRGADNLPYEKVGKNEPVCIADEVPFDIPDSWEWVRFCNVVNYSMGKTPPRKESEYWNNPVHNWVSIADMVSDGHIAETKEGVSAYAADVSFKGRKSLAGTLLMSFKLTVGKVSILDIDAFHNEAIISIHPFVDDNKIMTSYLFAVLPLLSQLGETKTAIKGNTLNSDSLDNLWIPLPPLNEQNRICSKLKELIPVLSNYAEFEQEIKALNLSFPEKLKKSILQEAVQGKLVPQDENDEPASVLLERIRTEKQALIKAGKIKKDKNESVIFRRDNSHYEKCGSEEVCIDEELPFEIPSSWEWSRLSSLAYNIFAGGDKPKDFTKKATVENKFPVIANGITNDGILGYTAKPTAPANTITVAGRGTIGFSLYRTYEYCPIVRLIVIEQCRDINPQYLQYVLEAFPEKSLGTSIPQLTVPMLKPKLIPVPPLSEQNRIVKQIDKLLSTVKLL